MAGTKRKAAKGTGSSAKKKTARSAALPGMQVIVAMCAVVVAACALFLTIDYIVTRPAAGAPAAPAPAAGVPAAPAPAAPAEPAPAENPVPAAETPTTSPKPAAPEPSGGSATAPVAVAVPPSQGTAPSAPAAISVPPAVGNAAVCFVIDDAGENVGNVRAYTELPLPLTIAVLPRVRHSRECADVARAAGKEVILHQPMQAKNPALNPGEGAITGTMPADQIGAVIAENLRIVGPVRGMNNHEGSLITADALRMGAVLDACAAAGIYFIDSRTAVAEENRVHQAAAARNMGILERNAPFLDNEVARDQMLSELLKGLAVANRQGYAVIIGHVDKSVRILPALLREVYPELVRQGYTVTTPSHVRTGTGEV